ncbi:MAG TPA: hypothetical protein VMH79_10875 [Thermoanaerobaculia bacterium]|nr:hypothetical protein [Thermoanaerobaculia bacterium]
MKVLKWMVAVLLAVMPVTVPAAPDEAPEIRVTLHPAGDYVPAGYAADAYTFKVIASLGEVNESKLGLSTEVVLQPGHTKAVYRENGDLRLEGNAKVDESGQLMYRLTLRRGEVRLATATSAVVWGGGDDCHSHEPAPR